MSTPPKNGDSAEPVYSIRVPAERSIATCTTCGKRFQACGPVGYVGDDILCDLCCMAANPVGSILPLMSVTRLFAISPFGERERESYFHALAEVAAFVRLLENAVWCELGPPRFFESGEPQKVAEDLIAKMTAADGAEISEEELAQRLKKVEALRGQIEGAMPVATEHESEAL